MELDVLRIVSLQKHENIINLLAFYTWRDTINFVFPFAEGDLHMVLYEGWSPSSKPGDQFGGFTPDYWLWKQIDDVADALRTIHNPPQHDIFPGQTDAVIAFHFDLKPKNILVTSNGVLKITDFGQSLIRLVGTGERPDGTFGGGDFTYAAPEVETSNPAAELRSHSGSSAVDSSYIYLSRKEFPTVLLNYDVWSLACVMLEVLVSVQGGSSGPQDVQSLRRNREQEGGRPEYHLKGALKECIKIKLSEFADTSDGPDGQYLNSLVSLLEKMFEPEPKERIHSRQVCETLMEMRSEYEATDSNPVTRRWRRRPAGMRHEEIGWNDAGKLRSFIDL